jgi:hypothetical protein
MKQEDRLKKINDELSNNPFVHVRYAGISGAGIYL